MVVVTWEDSYFDLDEPNMRSEYLMTTMGYLIEEGDRWVRIASESSPDGYRAVTHIPRVVVREVRPLMLGAPKPP